MNISRPACRPAPPLAARTVATLALAVSAALAGCASGPEPRESAPVPTLPATAAVADGAVRADTDDARIAQLWSAAQQAYSGGDATASLEHLYEALAIAPDNGLLWSRAAEIQLDAEQPALAENLAVKSNAVAGDNRGLQYRNWLIIEHARDMRGDLLGVRSANRKVRQLQYE